MNTIAHERMPRTNESWSRLKLLEEDHALALETQTVAQKLFRTVTLQEILRDAIHIGLPRIAEKYQAMAAAAKKAAKE